MILLIDPYTFLCCHLHLINFMYPLHVRVLGVIHFNSDAIGNKNIIQHFHLDSPSLVLCNISVLLKVYKENYFYMYLNWDNVPLEAL